MMLTAPFILLTSQTARVLRALHELGPMPLRDLSEELDIPARSVSSILYRQGKAAGKAQSVYIKEWVHVDCPHQDCLIAVFALGRKRDAPRTARGNTVNCRNYRRKRKERERLQVLMKMAPEGANSPSSGA